MNQTPTTAVLLAAGRGQRLRPYTDHTPKPLLPVNGRPTLDYVLTAAQQAGIKNIILVTHHLAEQIEQYVADGAAWGLTAVCCRQPEMLGTAHALQTAVTAYPHLFEEELPFLLTATDYILPPTYLADLTAAHQQNGADITISLKELPLADIIGRSCVKFEENGHGRGRGRIVRIIEKPIANEIDNPFTASLTFILPGVTLDYLGRVRPSPRGELEIQDAINQMIAAGLTAGGLVQPTPREWTLETDAPRG
ncbi:MAG: nucleotidyltransferase family protein [Ardenticatenaceae bacterium]|nr:nucleotidyltransferase family protein [Ardenticatenaceae bacterium]